MIGPLGFFLLAAATSSSSSSDDVFHNWCDTVGIQTPQARLRTTSESVAGRGVFAVGDVEEGDVVISIPEYLLLHEYNAEQGFPALTKRNQDIRQNYFDNSNKRKWWRRLLSKTKRTRKQNDVEEFHFVTPDDFWQAELTSYAIAALKQENHIWAPWIEQWQRNDPMQRMFKKGISWKDEDAVNDGVKELQKSLPDVPDYKLRAAVHIRLGRMEELQRLHGMSDDDLEMYGTLISRAIEIGDGVIGVIPMFDMINHSRKPNLGLHFNGKEFGLCALRDIQDGEEFFLCYGKVDNGDGWDENEAVWSLVQWGIPEPRVLSHKEEVFI